MGYLQSCWVAEDYCLERGVCFKSVPHLAGPVRLDANDLKRLCAEVRRFSMKADLTWKGLPKVCWEFVQRKDFEEARFLIMSILKEELIPTTLKGHERIMGSETMEIDCMGVTFRLVCRDRVYIGSRSYGIGDI